MGLRRARAAWIALVAPAVAIALVVGLDLGGVALAQQAHPAARPHPARTAPPKKAPAADAGAAPAGLAAPAPASVPGASAPADAGVVESKTLDGGTHVFKFTELDIEGRLKSPQLVYFLRRVRAEFAAGDLGHRSFMREMSETRKESSF